MKLVLDTDRCQGHGRCYTLAADVAGSDEDGYPVLLHDELDPALAAAAEVAVENCPEQALRLTDGQ